MRLRRVTVVLLLAAIAVACGRRTPVKNLAYRASRAMSAYEFRRAEALFEQALVWDAEDYDVLYGLARVSTSLGEYPRAYAYLAKAEGLAPWRSEAARGRGRLAIVLDRKEDARRWYEKAVELGPDSPANLAGLASVAIEEENYEEADALLTRAEGLSPRFPSVISTRAHFHFRKRDMTRSAALYRRALEIVPTYMAAHKRLANGFLELDREPYEPPDTPEGYDTAVGAAAWHYETLDLDFAESAFQRLDTEDAADGRPAFYRGLVALRRGRPREAIPHLWRAHEREPDSFLFRNALGTAYDFKLARQRPEYGGGEDPTDRLAPFARELPDEDVPGIEKLVRGYDRLLPRERRVILRAARPIARYLYALRKKMVRHDILGFEEGVCDAPERAYLQVRRTHDKRCYRALRGVGGRHAATGIEAVLAAVELRYDTFAHEIAHQVHVHGMSVAEKEEVKRLYAAAMAEDRCLDYYAETNEREYFAQGYEAFVSLVKSPYHQAMRRHTRAELKARDPGLYAFIVRITGTPDPDPEVVRLAPRIRAFYEWAGDEISLAQVNALLDEVPAPAADPR
ncbi:MAG: tetratricopeptide repeat protein [Planctomycetota bacterium]|jgi:tetratricopeptide (TPR) repeat protein